MEKRNRNEIEDEYMYMHDVRIIQEINSILLLLAPNNVIFIYIIISFELFIVFNIYAIYKVIYSFICMYVYIYV